MLDFVADILNPGIRYQNVGSGGTFPYGWEICASPSYCLSHHLPDGKGRKKDRDGNRGGGVGIIETPKGVSYRISVHELKALYHIGIETIICL